MGANTSNLVQLSKNEELNRFVSKESLIPNHPFWNGMLSYKLKTPRTKSEWKQFEESTDEIAKRFMVNNLKTGNFGALVQVFLTRQSELKSSLESDSSLFLWQTYNALFIIRVCIKFFIGKIKEEDVIRQFEAQPAVTDEQASEQNKEDEVEAANRFEAFINALVKLITDLPQRDMTYALHLEAVATLLILLSTPLFSTKPAFQTKAYRVMMSHKAPSTMGARTTKALLENYVNQTEAPAQNEGGSLVLGLASGMWNILTLGYSSVAAPPAAEVLSKTPLADMSLLLLLVLTNHCTDSTEMENTYRTALFNCSNSAEKSSDGDVPSDPNSFKIDYSKLFKALCGSLHTDESTLLLYLLLHQNKSFKTYLLASSDMDLIVVPILKTLYHAPESNNHHIYMSLIVLLILSEEDLFNTSVHDCMLKGIDWYTERALAEISLGGLLILVVIRTVQYNMLKMRDKYLHTNCLAALANMSSQFRNLHPYVSQRIVSMFEALAKKHSRLVTTLHHAGELEGLDEDSPISEALADAAVLEEVLRMILEIMNSCFVSQIKNNSNLIYTVLYKRELFEPFMAHPTFQDLSQNLQTVIVFFSSKLEQIQEKKERTLGVSEVQEIIRQAAIQFPREKLTKFPDLKFKYVEEEQPEDFFVPYIWTLVTESVYWNPQSIKLFQPHSPSK